MIKHLQDLLFPYIGSNKIIKDAKYSDLIEPGENYGSKMLKLDIKLIDNENKQEEDLHLVAKTLPQSESVRKLFRIQTTYTNEMAFYDVIIPTILDFQREIGVKNVLNCFAKCYGTRKNLLKDSEIIDDDAVLLLENLRTSGFSNINRTIGFDYDNAKATLKTIAHFHAIFLALKLKKPDVFMNKVKPYCCTYKPPQDGPEYKVKIMFEKLIEDNKACQKLAHKVKVFGDVEKSAAREPFSTLIHSDLWVNNTMQKFENGIAVENKLIDFQIYTYGSPAEDVFFFLWTSVRQAVLEKHLDDLLIFYHKEFVDVLISCECDTSLFSYEQFLEEIRLEAEYGFTHTFFICMVLGMKGVFSFEPESREEVMKKASLVYPQAKKKICYMVEECHKRGWLY